MMTEGLRAIRCGNCGVTTLHLSSILRQVCAHLPESSTETERINYCCPKCKHLRHAWIPSEIYRADPQNLAAPIADTIPFLAAIECDGGSNPSCASVFAPMRRGTGLTQAIDHLRASIVDTAIRSPEGLLPMIPCDAITDVGSIPTVSTDNCLKAAHGQPLMSDPRVPIMRFIAVDGYGRAHAEEVQGCEEGAHRCGLACRASSGLPRGLGPLRPRGAYRRCRQGQGHGACRHAG